ncbi:MAG: hypothetical protein WA957_07200, partial [Alteraurantiacibacter sp.]
MISFRKPFAFSISLVLALGTAWQPVQAQETQSASSHSQQIDTGESDERSSRAQIVPYIEASQVITAQLQPGDDVLTYT